MLGIDVCKKTLSCTLVNPDSQKTVWYEVFPNTTDGVNALLSKTPDTVAFVVEPTGRYSLTVVKQAMSLGRTVLLAEPKKAQLYLQSLPTRAKTDKLDSRGLALYGLDRPLRPFPVKDDTVEHVDQLLKARRGIVQSITSLKQRESELPHAREWLVAAVSALEQQKLQIDSQIAELTSREERFRVIQLLQTIPGIGPVTATSVASCLLARDFTDPDQFVSFIGLDPTTIQSGDKSVHGRLTKKGDSELRRLLYLAAQSNLHCSQVPYKALFERYVERGLPKTAALCAVARKIARTCWSVARHQTPFDPNRVSQQSTHQLDRKP